MNEIIGVREMILDAAKKIAADEGVLKINMRLIATTCNIAVGTAYNHFPNKGDLIAAVIGDFWENAFSNMDFQEICKLPPVDALESFYNQLSKYLSAFKVNWLEQLSLLNSSEKQIGRVRESEMFVKITTFITKIIAKEEFVTTEYSEQELARLSSFIFQTMMVMLRQDETDFSFAHRLLTKILHA